MYEWIVKGGVVMIPIILSSVIALAVTIERLINLTMRNIHPTNAIERLKKLLAEGKYSEALAICTNSTCPTAKIIEAGIVKRQHERAHIKEAVEHAGSQVSDTVYRYLSTLSTIASVAPLLGLLGTVTGMIRAFEVISLGGIGKPTDLASGISEALITTAAGLIVAIPTLVVHNYLYKKANRLIMEMENTSMEIVDILEKQ
ncbi:MAG: MotA/TolQ/ExbB proton channel family protein [Candidatus Schekmanbacteria bacterium]|nr:MotA/TolQ/ExbB proton channel family protein [Candidatus Schekmanbacteria bacterium]